jgi:hypothetical protein
VKNDIALRYAGAFGDARQGGLREPDFIDAIHGRLDQLVLAELALLLAISAGEIFSGYLYGHVNPVSNSGRMVF